MVPPSLSPACCGYRFVLGLVLLVQVWQVASKGRRGGELSEAWRWLGTRQHGQTKKRAACTSDARTVMDVRAERCGDDPYGVLQPAWLAWPWLVIVVSITAPHHESKFASSS